MKSRNFIGILSAAMLILPCAWTETGAETGTKAAADPVVGGSVIAVNVDIVAATGYRASKLLGADIYNEQGETVGKLEDFIVASDANVSIAIVGVGGFLGMGERLVAVPASLFKSNDQGQTVLPNATKDQLEALPEFRYAK
jgi:sporulation protein YlmC with PRC-barrel domain